MRKIKCSPYSLLFWNEFKMSPESCSYNIVVDQTIIGPLDIPHLENAIDGFIADHILFDSHLLDEDGQIYWVKNHRSGRLNYFSGIDEQQQFIRQTFDVEHGPLYRFALFETGKDEYELIIVLHHLIIDGPSLNQFLHGIEARYNRTATSRPLEAKEIADINEKITRDSEELCRSGGETVWKNRHHDFNRNDAALQFSGVDHLNRHGDALFFSLSKTDLKNCRPDKPLRHVAPFHLFISAWGALLARYGNTETSQISFPVAIEAGRDLSFGAHINVAVLSMRHVLTGTFRQLYESNLNFFREARSASGARYTELPTHLIARACGTEIFDIGFAQTNLRDYAMQFAGCKTKANQRYFDDMGGASLLLEYCEHEDNFIFRLRYLRGVFSADQMHACSSHYLFFLRQLLSLPDAPIGALPLADEREQCELAAPNAADTLRQHRSKRVADAWWIEQRQGVGPAIDIGVMATQRFDPRRVRTVVNIASQLLTLDTSTTASLQAFCQARGLTFRELAQFGWHKILQVWSGSSQTTAGTMVRGRDLDVEGVETSVRLYDNALPLALNWSQGATVDEMLRQIQQRIEDLDTHCLSAPAAPQRSEERLFHSLITFENYSNAWPATGQLEEQSSRSAEQLDYPVAIVARHHEKVLTLRFEYDADSFTFGDITRLKVQFRNLLLALSGAGDKPHDTLDIISAEERYQLVHTWNPPTAPVPDYGLAARFELMVERHAARIALASETHQYDYLAVNRRVNQLAHHIRQRYLQLTGLPIEEDTLVAVCMGRSLDTIIAMLAVIKAGAAYVPMDPEAPFERQRYILADAGSRLVLTQATLLLGLKPCAPDAEWIVVDHHCATNASEENPGIYRAPHHLANVIYTSGTTGNPKGVLIEQSSVIGLVVDSDTVRINEQDTFLQMASLAFDTATMEIWGPLLNGAKLAMSVQREQLWSDARLFEAFLRVQHVTIGLITRSLFDHMYLANPTQFSRFRYLLVGGEALTPEIMRQLASQPLRPEVILNGYGPTESTVLATTYSITDITSTEGAGAIPIGRALRHRTCYVLDQNGNLLPRGAIGELCIGGGGLARGYLNLPSLTQDRFVSNPFAQEGHERMYKTGDLVRWLPDGQLEYLGRNDLQVKIRGYRIELAEIEAKLLMHSDITQCVVTAREPQGQSGRRHELLAWYVATRPLTVEHLSAWLTHQLPDYMIPAHFIPLDSLPLTLNGKLDRAALLKLEARVDTASGPTPRSALEKTLHAVWCDVLGATQINVEDDFYRIGGDSILSILLTSELRKHDIACTVRTVFEQRTIARLAHWLENQQATDRQISEQGALTGQFPLLPIQSWFASQGFSQPHHWNQAFIVSVPALRHSDVNDLVATLHAHHDMLRANFHYDAAKITSQSYQPDLPAPQVVILDAAMGQQVVESRLTELQSSFDLTRGPLWCIAWIHNIAAADQQHLFFAAHHLVMDAISWRIIQDDVKTLCSGGTLEKKGSSYRQWVAATENYAAEHAGQVAVWQQQIADQPNYWQRADIIDEYHHTPIRLDTVQTGRMLKETASAFHTEINDLLLSALSIALQRWHGHRESWLTLEGHGREEIDPRLDVGRTVGWFTCMYPIKLSTEDTLISTIRGIKEALRAIPDKGMSYGALKYGYTGDVDIGALKAHCLPAISFNYLGQFTSGESGSPWQISTEGCGIVVDARNADSNLINIAGGVFEQSLRLSITSRLRPDIAQKLADDFTEVLNEIIELCVSESSQERSLFSPSDFPDMAISPAELDRLQDRHKIENIYRATNVQRELMYFNRVDPDYQIDQAVLRIDGPFEPQRMSEAWAHVVAQHDVLRAGFSDRDSPGDPHLFICKQVTVPIQSTDWSLLDEEAMGDTLRQTVLQQRNRAFDFDRPPLFRILIARIEAERHLLIFTFNHILFDGWSFRTMLKEITAAYVSLQEGVPAVKRIRSFAPFPRFLQRDFDHQQARTFWEPYLQGAKRNQRLPRDATETVDTCRQFRMRCVNSALTLKHNDALYEFGKTHCYTANQLCQLAWMLVLSESLNEDDVSIGSTMSARPTQIGDAAHLVGLFIASPVLRLTAIRQRSVPDLLDDIARTQPDRQQFAFYELNQYDQNWVPESPFGSLFVFQNMPELDLGSDPPFRISLVDAVSGSNHQTVFCLSPHPEGLRLQLFYDARELAQETVARLLARFTTVLVNMVTMPIDPTAVQHMLLSAE
ncbi:amino acid adenylation domain-containing protein [Paraburkholderia fungorum]|uniref:amino acid adenylation domain-containing protein n=1 Tax=Paraburkholderia fungorum TaxID=134537 RepID=UPI0038B9B035